MEDGSSEDGLPPSSYVGTSGEVTSVAYDIPKQNLATVTSEGTISVFSRQDHSEEWHNLAEWKIERQFPLTQVTWAHPEFGGLLAVGGSDGEVSLWRRRPNTQKEPSDSPTGSTDSGAVFQLEGSVALGGRINALAFGARERGLHLAVASSSSCSILRSKGSGAGGWQIRARVAPQLSGAEHYTCLCWQPFSEGIPPVLLLGSTNGAKVWMYKEPLMNWREVKTLARSVEVASVDWEEGPHPQELVALAHGSTVQLLGLKGAVDNLQVEEVAELAHPSPIVRVGWHPTQGWLAVSLQASLVHLWRANFAGEWTLIRRLLGSPESES